MNNNQFDADGIDLTPPGADDVQASADDVQASTASSSYDYKVCDSADPSVCSSSDTIVF